MVSTNSTAATVSVGDEPMKDTVRNTRFTLLSTGIVVRSALQTHEAAVAGTASRGGALTLGLGGNAPALWRQTLKGSGRCIAEAHEARQGQCGIHFRPQWKSSPNASPWLFNKCSGQTLWNSHCLNRNQSIIFEPPFRKINKEGHVWVWTQTSGSFSRGISTECRRLPKWKKWLLKLYQNGQRVWEKSWSSTNQLRRMTLHANVFEESLLLRTSTCPQLWKKNSECWKALVKSG